jgi:hypothetical protein
VSRDTALEIYTKLMHMGAVHWWSVDIGQPEESKIEVINSTIKALEIEEEYEKCQDLLEYLKAKNTAL